MLHDNHLRRHAPAIAVSAVYARAVGPFSSRERLRRIANELSSLSSTDGPRLAVWCEFYRGIPPPPEANSGSTKPSGLVNTLPLLLSPITTNTAQRFAAYDLNLEGIFGQSDPVQTPPVFPVIANHLRMTVHMRENCHSTTHARIVRSSDWKELGTNSLGHNSVRLTNIDQRDQLISHRQTIDTYNPI